jgi:hypothetical protein
MGTIKLTNVYSFTVTKTTVTVTTYSIYGQDPAKRNEPAAVLNPRSPMAIAPRITTTNSVPIYASAYSGSARYSSACPCIGITPAAVTAPAITQTVSSGTVTHTSTIGGKQTKPPNLPYHSGRIMANLFFLSTQPAPPTPTTASSTPAASMGPRPATM